MSIEIKKISSNGEGIGFINSMPILLYGGLVGDEVDYQIIQKHPTYYEGKITKFIKYSKDRIKHNCKNKCDGCPLIEANYEAQLKWKKEIILTNLKHTNISESLVEDIIKNPNYSYRNLVKLPIVMHQGELKCGMYKHHSNRTTIIDDCLIHEPELEKVRKDVLKILNKYHLPAYDRKSKKGLRSLYLRGIQNKYQLALVGGKDQYPDELLDELMRIEGMNSIYQNIQIIHDPRDVLGKQMIHLRGTKALSFKINKAHLCLSLHSFFQMNTDQAIKLYDTVISLLPDNVNTLVEAYCGIGAMSYLAHDKAKKIIGIEFEGSSIRDAEVALKRNPYNNISFIKGDAATKLKEISKKEKIDWMIVDPPRTGLNDEMINTINKVDIDNIIYVSCNPYTLFKNLNQLEKYQVKRIIPIDLFSNTPHVETVCLLTHS